MKEKQQDRRDSLIFERNQQPKLDDVTKLLSAACAHYIRGHYFFCFNSIS